MGFNLISNKVERSHLSGGDHIYVYRAGHLYSHHGIYMGEGRVVHFCSTSQLPSSSSSSSKARKRCSACESLDYRERTGGVVLSCLDCFLRKGTLRRYAYGVPPLVYFLTVRVVRGACNTAQSSPADVVMERALQLLQTNGFGEYDVLTKNCEDFATFCKTGQDCSRDGCARGLYGQASAFYNARFSRFYRRNAP